MVLYNKIDRQILYTMVKKRYLSLLLLVVLLLVVVFGLRIASQLRGSSITIDPHPHYYVNQKEEAGNVSSEEALEEDDSSNNRSNSNSTTSSSSSDSVLMIDIISIGSLQRPEYQDAQQATFATHPSVRHFFRIHEQDDVDQGDKNCPENLTWLQVQNISGFCGGMRHRVKDKHPFLYNLRIKFANVQWLGRKTNPVGWLCAQKRPMAGLYKVAQFYRNKNNPQPQQTQTQPNLPHFLMILDDDTYVHMDRVVDYLIQFQSEKYQETHDKNLVMAGCVIRGRIKRFKWTFPFGGWGTIFNRGALETILTPLYCNTATTTINRDDERIRDICVKLQKDRIGEYQMYQEGMSLLDVMNAYVMREPYVDQASWNLGFCLHSDWVWGCKFCV